MFTKTYTLQVPSNNKINLESNHHISAIKIKSYEIDLTEPFTGDYLFLTVKSNRNNICSPNEITINNDNKFVMEDTILIDSALKNTTYIDYVITSVCCISGDHTCPIFAGSRYKYNFTISLHDENKNDIKFNKIYLIIEVLSC